MTRKKLKIVALAVFLFLVTLEVAAVLSNNLFFEKVAAKEVKRRVMPASTANAVKHAYAASLLYSTLRSAYFSETSAKSATIFLGKVNEVAEVIFKPHQDSSLEMMKDLSNNLIGICAAKWIEENHENPLSQDRLDFVGLLAEQNKLILFREDVPLSAEERLQAQKTSDYSLAKKWFDENEEKVVCDF